MLDLIIKNGSCYIDKDLKNHDIAIHLEANCMVQRFVSIMDAFIHRVFPIYCDMHL